MLTGKYLPGQPVPEGSRATSAEGSDFISGWLRDDVLTAVQELRPIADDLGLSMAQLALAWVLTQPGISAAIIGATRPEQVIDNVRASGLTLDAATCTRIDDVLGSVVNRNPADTRSPSERPKPRS